MDKIRGYLLSGLRYLFRDRFPDREHKAWMWLGHYSLAALTAVVAAIITIGAFGKPHGWLQLVGVIPVIAWLLVIFVAEPHHQHRLCARCARHTPLDPQAAADRWKPAFRYQHSRWKIAPTIVILIWALGTSPVKGQPLWEYLLNSAVLIMIVLTYIPAWQHVKLQPWCPWCTWGDGGDHEDAPDVPAPTVSV